MTAGGCFWQRQSNQNNDIVCATKAFNNNELVACVRFVSFLSESSFRESIVGPTNTIHSTTGRERENRTIENKIWFGDMTIYSQNECIIAPQPFDDSRGIRMLKTNNKSIWSVARNNRITYSKKIKVATDTQPQYFWHIQIGQKKKWSKKLRRIYIASLKCRALSLLSP